MNVNVFNMNEGRANFMEAIEQMYGRIETITRKQLVEFEASWIIGQTGPKREIGLRWPAWLTGLEMYRGSARGTFRLPWEDYDNFIEHENELSRKRISAEDEDRRLKTEKAAAKAEKVAAREAKKVAREAKKAAKLQLRKEALAKRVSNKQLRLDALVAKKAARDAARAEKQAAKVAKNTSVTA
jgi:hypothetical protein